MCAEYYRRAITAELDSLNIDFDRVKRLRSTHTITGYIRRLDNFISIVEEVVEASGHQKDVELLSKLSDARIRFAECLINKLKIKRPNRPIMRG